MFEVFLTIYGLSGHRVQVTQMPRAYACLPYPWRLHKHIVFDLPSSFREKDV